MIGQLSSPEKVFAFGASPSMVGLWRTCRHRWWLHYIARVGRDEKTVEASSGIASHKFWQTYHDPNYRNALTVDEALEAFQEDYPEASEDAKRPQKHCVRVLREYTKVYPHASSDWEMLETELPIQVPIEGCALPLNVKLDGLLRYMNGLWVVDFKTSNQAINFEKYRNHSQTYMYIYAAQQYAGERCHGIWYDTVNYRKTLNRDNFQRKDFAKMAAQVTHAVGEWTKEVNEMYEFVTKNWQDRKAFAQANHESACYSFFRPCPFLNYCEMNQNERLLP